MTGNLSHSIIDILYSISKRSAFLKKNKLYSHFLTSICTVGFGGSGGLESPILLTGAAIGSNATNYVPLNYKDRILMIGCGTAAVISAIFNAPIAGIIFSIEVILVRVTIHTFTPLLISSAMATLTSIILYNDKVLFLLRNVDPFKANEIHYYLILAILCGMISIYFNKILIFSESAFKKINNTYHRALIGGVILSAIIFCFPSLYGEGYKSISHIFNRTVDS